MSARKRRSRSWPAGRLLAIVLLLAGAGRVSGADADSPRARENALEESLAKETKLREKAEADLAFAQRRLEESGKSAGKIRELEEQLVAREKDLAACNRRIEQAQTDQLGLVRQIAELQKAAKGISAIEGEVQRAQAEVDRLTRALAQREKAEGRAKSQEEEKATWTGRIQELEKALEEEKGRAAALDQEKAKLAKDAETLRENLAAQEKALTVAGEQIHQLRANVVAMETARRDDAEAAAIAQRKWSGEVSNLRQEAERRATELAARDKENREQERQLEEQSRAAAAQSADLGQVRQEKDSLARKYETARAKLQEAERAVEEKDKQLESERRSMREQLQQEGLVRQGKALREQSGAVDNTALAWSLNDVGLLMLSEDRADEAEEMFRKALAILDRTTGRSSVAAGTILQHLGDALWNQNHLDAAAESCEEAARIFRTELGVSHPRYAAALNGWARILRDLQRPEEAEKLYRQTIRIYEKNGSRTDLMVPLHNLGLLLLDQNRLSEAGPFLQRAVQIAEENRKPGDGQAVVVLRTMTRYWREVGDMEKAAQCEEKANEAALDVLAK